MKLLKLTLVGLIPLIVGCDEVRNLITKKEDVYLVCKGEMKELNSKYQLVYSDKDYTKTYTLKKDESKKWMIEVDGGKSTINSTPPEKIWEQLKSFTIIQIKPERIDVNETYIRNESQNREYEETIKTIEINRISGEWKERIEKTGKNKSDMRYMVFINGTCENGSKKF